jgi:hypothetical protein
MTRDLRSASAIDEEMAYDVRRPCGFFTLV